MIYVVGPRDKVPSGAFVVNTTSSSKDKWSCALSPFYLGPVPLYNGLWSKNMENAWQFAKVYPMFACGRDGGPTGKYFKWAKKGWKTRRAIRYPMGKM